MNLLDRAITLIDPARGLRRARARLMIDHVERFRSYEGASAGRRTDGWFRPGTDANAEISAGGARLRYGARDLVRNNPWASRAVGNFTTNAIGSGIAPRSENARINTRWQQWVSVADITGQNDFYGLEALVMRSVIESGECLVLRTIVPGSENQFGLRLRILEPDHLDRTRDSIRSGDNLIQDGIEFDPFGRRVAYWIYPDHPGSRSVSVRRTESIRVPASEVLHVYEALRPTQNRGATWFAPALIRLNDIGGYDDAELYRKRIEACFVGFVTDIDGVGESTAADAALVPPQETFEPGHMIYGRPGQDIKFGAPATTGGYAEFMRVQLQAVAVTFGMTYEQLAGDLSQVNFSSARMGLLEFRRRVKQVQCCLLIPMFCRPVWQWFLETEVPQGQPGQLRWLLPRYEAIEPLKEANAQLVSMRSGVDNLADIVAEDGRDVDTHLNTIAQTNAKLDKLGIILDSDARQTTRAGILQVEPDDGSDDEDEDEDDDEDAAASGEPPARSGRLISYPK